MEDLHDFIASAETPHADNELKPLPYHATRLLEHLRSFIKHLPHPFFETFD